ncbi:hypothetical protein ACFQ1S_25105 [Kibdelosporangium lantanae]|uniref:Uncharacterized protein n=1 Tax=Kibdelosporangium lantanae TaxID=1497396 RepID=A0ABW3MG03_9PSEU
MTRRRGFSAFASRSSGRIWAWSWAIEKYCYGTTRNESGFPTLDCNMTGGASGGPWLDNYGATFWAYLDGVNSWMFWNPDPTHVYKWQSPYFSYDTAGSLFDAVKDM